MTGETLRTYADNFLAVATRHPECHDGWISEVTDECASIELGIKVEMPQDMKIDGVAPNGVRQREVVTAILDSSYPWSTPNIYLRPDFPRDLPHLEPGSLETPPRPCLIEGNQREYFFQFGLVETGIVYLVHQLVIWLQSAAKGTLINPGQGWEPVMRQDLSHLLITDAEACRSMVDNRGGYHFLKARFYRTGPDEARLSSGAAAIVQAETNTVTLRRGDKDLLTSTREGDSTSGNTVCCVAWPDKLPDGKPFICNRYMPETVATYEELRHRADELGCGRTFNEILSSLERCFDDCALKPPVPIAVILCARRPIKLAGLTSDIELLPYIVDLRLTRERDSLFGTGGEEPVAPAVQLDVANPALLRRVSGAPETESVSMIGCGSVGSKMAMHLVRSGVQIPVVSDRGILTPHNMARHALARPPLAIAKAAELARELAHLGPSPQVHDRDLVAELATKEGLRTVLPKTTGYAVNTTASLAVREILSSLPSKDVKPRLAEAALFGRGHGAFLLVEGSNHNPTLCDLVAELYATSGSSDRLSRLLFDSEYGLSETQIGQGCSSMTMQMTDMRLSAMTANLSEALLDEMQLKQGNGQIIVGTTEERARDTSWDRQTVRPFRVIPIEASEGWTLRISQRILEQIQVEMGCYPEVETGGIMIGTCSARLKAITVVDLLPAPPDSDRSSGHFTLGTSGLKKAIIARHQTSGGTLFDVGTWHSHLADQGPSPLDRQTARELANSRPPPSVLLIATPERLYALAHTVSVP